MTIGMWFNIAKFTMFKENIREISETNSQVREHIKRNYGSYEALFTKISEEIRVGKRDILSIYMSM